MVIQMSALWPLLACLLSIAQAQHSLNQSSLAINNAEGRMLRAGGPLAREDSVMSGKYEILRCGAGIANSNAAMLQELLPQVWQNLQAARTDAQLGTTSVHGFTSFFKSNDNKATVNAIFGDISAGSEVVLNPDEAVRAGKQTSSPILVCLNAEDSLTQGLYHYMCTNENGYGIGHWQNSELIALCPKFFKLTAAPTANLCPSVLHNSLVPNDHRLLVNQYALFVYQLAHLYIPWHKRIGTATSQVTSYIQAAADANVVDSVGRPDNYAFYAAAIKAGCTKWPTGPVEGGLKYKKPRRHLESV